MSKAKSSKSGKVTVKPAGARTGKIVEKAVFGAARRGAGAVGNTKLSTVITLLRRPKGASINDLMNATGWQAHSVRGAISGAIKKKQGLAVTSEVSGDRRVYRIAG